MRNAGREIRRVRSRLDKLETIQDNYHDQQAEGLISMDRLRSKLASLGEQRAELERSAAELLDSGERLRELEVLPQMVEEYLRELPHLLKLEPVVREYETSAPEPTQDDPLSALYTITPERIRFLPEEELAEKRRAIEEKRARRFRELYAMLDLRGCVSQGPQPGDHLGYPLSRVAWAWAHASWDNASSVVSCGDQGGRRGTGERGTGERRVRITRGCGGSGVPGKPTPNGRA